MSTSANLLRASSLERVLFDQKLDLRPTERSYFSRKTIGPINDSAVDWVSFESIEIVIAVGSSGNSPNISL
jgi:hypothetical protein